MDNVADCHGIIVNVAGRDGIIGNARPSSHPGARSFFTSSLVALGIATYKMKRKRCALFDRTVKGAIISRHLPTDRGAVSAYSKRLKNYV